ncbi:uncharacterized protein VNE69_03111 [Vairimorpha necatrix]|uniref:Membrane protein n=1 Tax=Vairimorpha necatrix TaxID=6039 RepID=A0AAX4JAC0_9MICR
MDSITRIEYNFATNMAFVAKEVYEMYVSCYKNVTDTVISLFESLEDFINKNICFKRIGPKNYPKVIIKVCKKYIQYFERCKYNKLGPFYDRSEIYAILQDNKKDVSSAICYNETYEFQDDEIPDYSNMTDFCNKENNKEPLIQDLMTKICKHEEMKTFNKTLDIKGGFNGVSTKNLDMSENEAEFANIGNKLSIYSEQNAHYGIIIFVIFILIFIGGVVFYIYNPRNKKKDLINLLIISYRNQMTSTLEYNN